MFNRSIIISSILVFYSFNSTHSFAQQSFEIKGGLTYILNKSDYTDHKGYNISLTYSPVNYEQFSLGFEVGYNIKGYFRNFSYLPQYESPVEFISLGIPFKTYINFHKDFDIFLTTGVRYDVILTNSGRFFPSIGGEPSYFKSTLGIKAGTGIQFTSIYPNIIFEISINPDLNEFVENHIKNTTLELKTGILFDGFSSKK